MLMLGSPVNVEKENVDMNVIQADCVDVALKEGLSLLSEQGVRENTRNGDALVMPNPVTTVNDQPMHRVSFSPSRNANPAFHLMEALWMLAGRNDVRWLDQFVGDFSKRFGEQTPQGTYQHGAYGFRWRKHFDLEGGGERPLDQLDVTVALLKKNHFDRRVVIAMWDPMADLNVDKKDIPCNTHIYPRIRKVVDDLIYPSPGMSVETEHRVLDLTVCCRSNDAIWGAHGANAVHFSVLQEYLAARIGVEVGTLYQMSNNYHAYRGEYDKIWPKMRGEQLDDYDRIQPTPIVTVPDKFDDDLTRFFADDWETSNEYQNVFFWRVAVPIRQSYAYWRKGDHYGARKIVERMYPCDWSIAANNWFERKMMHAAGVKREA